MIDVETALKTVLRDIRVLNSEAVKLRDSLGRILAKDIYSNIDVPSFDNSAMDGYAVRASGTSGSSKEKSKNYNLSKPLRQEPLPKRY